MQAYLNKNIDNKNFEYKNIGLFLLEWLFYYSVMERYKAVKKELFLIWDESRQEYWYNGPEWLSFEFKKDAEA